MSGAPPAEPGGEPQVAEPVDGERFEGVYLSQLSRVFALLRDKLPLVFAANRHFEERTGLHNEAGTNNLVDALSHIGTLVEHAHELDRDGQGEQVAHLEDHLRRSMMEAFESLVKLYLGQAADLWDEHERRVRPLLANGDLVGVAPVAELEGLRIRVRDLIDAGRETKRSPDWQEWERGTADLIEACDAVDELQRRLREGLAAAEREQRLREGRSMRGVRARSVAVLALGSGIVGVLATVLVGRVL